MDTCLVDPYAFTRVPPLSASGRWQLQGVHTLWERAAQAWLPQQAHSSA